MAEQLQKGFAEVNGTTLYYEVAGEGHPLVLNHGGLVDHHLWDGQFDAFAQHFKVIRYDIRGFGASGMLSKGMEPYSMERDLHSLLQFLGIEKTYVLGLSLGGTLAIDFTLQYPEMVDALITVGSGLSGFEWGEPDQELMAKFAAMVEAFKSRDSARSVEISTARALSPFLNASAIAANFAMSSWSGSPHSKPLNPDPTVISASTISGYCSVKSMASVPPNDRPST